LLFSFFAVEKAGNGYAIRDGKSRRSGTARRLPPVLFWTAMPVATSPAAAHSVWVCLRLELTAHHSANLAVLVALLVLLLARVYLPRGDQWRVRFPTALFLLYILSLPARAELHHHMLEADQRYVSLAAQLLLAVGFVTTAAILVFDFAGRRLARMRILRDVATLLAGGAVMMALLSRAGVNFLSIITTSAVLTVVLGLALQETLGNILSGIAVQLEATVSPGDWVQVNDVNGQVSEIRWRSTVIITRNDDMVVVPHSVMAKSVLVNHSRPVGWQRRWVRFDVHYRHPPNEVERIVLDAIAGVPGVRYEAPEPDCVLMAMEQDHAQYALRYRLTDLRRDDHTDGEMRKRIWYALRRNNIEIPYPSRNIFVTELNKAREEAKSHKERERRMASLRGVDLFAPLDEEEIGLLADRMKVELFGDGETVLRQGAPGDSLYLIRRGAVAILVEEEGGQREVARLAENEFFGEMSLLTGAPRRATMVARGDAECYVIDRALFQEVLAQGKSTRCESVVQEITRILGSRQSVLQRIGEEAAHSTAEARADLLDRVKRFFGVHRAPSSAQGG
jgi:small-conductance mechanosensitive channel/CRP-like cAMP-binding protein